MCRLESSICCIVARIVPLFVRFPSFLFVLMKYRAHFRSNVITQGGSAQKGLVRPGNDAETRAGWKIASSNSAEISSFCYGRDNILFPYFMNIFFVSFPFRNFKCCFPLFSYDFFFSSWIFFIPWSSAFLIELWGKFNATKKSNIPGKILSIVECVHSWSHIFYWVSSKTTPGRITFNLFLLYLSVCFTFSI